MPLLLIWLAITTMYLMQLVSPMVCKYNNNKTGYTSTPVACGWAGTYLMSLMHLYRRNEARDHKYKKILKNGVQNRVQHEKNRHANFCIWLTNMSFAEYWVCISCFLDSWKHEKESFNITRWLNCVNYHHTHFTRI